MWARSVKPRHKMLKIWSKIKARAITKTAFLDVFNQPTVALRFRTGAIRISHLIDPFDPEMLIRTKSCNICGVAAVRIPLQILFMKIPETCHVTIR